MLPLFDEMISEGLVTLEKVQVLRYRASRSEGEQKDQQ
jgi:hypothetical protein